MDLASVAVHLCDGDFRLRFPCQEAFTVPAPHMATEKKECPRAALVSPWMADGSGETHCEQVPLGWRCPLCGTVEVEKLFWRTHFKTDADLAKLRAAEVAAAKGSRSNRRRLQKEKLREKRLAVRPFCDNCYVCPRCPSGSGGALGGLQMHLTHATDKEDELQYHVSCPHCQWQTYRSFPSIETLLGYLSTCDAHSSYEDTLRPWRRAQKEANNLLRAFYSPSVTQEQSEQHQTSSYSLSRMAWSKYLDILRPPQRAPNQHGQDASSAHFSLSHDVSFGVATPAAAQAPVCATPLPVVPRLNLSTGFQTDSESKRDAHEQKGEDGLVREIKESGTIYTSPDGMHPSVALDKLRALYEWQQLYEGKHLFESSNAFGPRKLPSYVRCLTEHDMVLLQHQKRSMIKESADRHSSGQDAARLSGGVSANNNSDSHLLVKSAAVNEATLFGDQQAGQLGLHPLFTGSSPDTDELQRAMLPSHTLMNSAVSGYTVPTRTGLRKDTPIARGSDSAGVSPIPFASPRPITARNVAADGPQVVILEALLSQPAHADFISSLFSYYIEHPRKQQVTALVTRGTSTRQDAGENLVLLSCSGIDNSDVQRILEYWSSSEPDTTGKAEDEETRVVDWRSDGFVKRPLFSPGSCYTATRNLPFIKPVAATAGSLTLRLCNLGTQTTVLRELKVVKLQLGGVRCTLAATDASGIPTFSSPSTWLRLLPKCTAVEAAIAGQVDRATAVLPLHLTDACSARRPEKEWSVVVAASHEDEPTGTGCLPPHGFIGFQVDVLTFLPPLGTVEAVSTSPSQSTNGITGDYHQICYNASVVW